MIASGFVVEPLLHDGQLFSMVTYLAQVGVQVTNTNPNMSHVALSVVLKMFLSHCWKVNVLQVSAAQRLTFIQ